ncbi:spherulin-2A [Amyelois transitella]|uniref:spherulin-2A n=1 Tax=Amyelois transitella TaxID=680683 RepID=UPI00298FF2D5|nr:spherulin-2A [Amyelois transitella]
MASIYLLLTFPALVLASIDIEVSGKFDHDHSNLKVYYSGKQVDVITDKERNTFELNDGKLKDAIAAYFGRRPDDAYLRSPTPWNDLYRSYGWNQVLRTLTPKRGKILGISSQPTIVMQQVFENNSTKPADFDVGIHQTVQNTVSSSWSKSGDLTLGQEIKYGFDLEVLNGGVTTAFRYTSSWGENTQKSESITIGSTAGMKILLQPGQAVLASLHATRGTIKIELEYEASLSGDAAVNYDDAYRGHHFWGLDVGAVMASNNLQNKKVSREIIEFGFYSESKVVVNDKNTSVKVLEVAF